MTHPLLRWSCLLLGILIHSSVAAAWYKELPVRAEVDRQIEKALYIGAQGNHLQAIDSLLSTSVRYQVDPGGSIGAKLSFLIGIEMMRAKDYSHAARYLLEAKAHEDKLSLLHRRDLNSFLAGVYMNLKEWDLAARFYHENLEHERSAGNKASIPTAENNLGIFHLQMGALDSAQWYFSMALQHDQQLPEQDKYFTGSILDNLARLYKQRHQYRQALEIYQQNVLTYDDGYKNHSLMQALIGVAEMQVALGAPQLALPILQRASKLLPTCNPRFQEDLQADWFKVSLKQARAVGDIPAFDRLLLQKDAVEDSLHNRLQHNLEVINGGQVQLLQRSFYKEKEVQELRLAKEAEEREDLQAAIRRTWVWAILLILVLGLVLTLRFRSLHFRQQSLKDQLQLQDTQLQMKETQAELMKKRLAEEQLSVENLQLKVALKQQDLVNFALDNQRKREVLQQLGKQLKRLKPGQLTQSNINAIINEMVVQTQAEAISKHYEEHIDEVNAEYKSNLLRRFPDLSPADLELCGMIRIGMQAKEIAVVRSVTENAILMARRRLRKRLKIKNGVDLRAFLSEDHPPSNLQATSPMPQG